MAVDAATLTDQSCLPPTSSADFLSIVSRCSSRCGTPEGRRKRRRTINRDTAHRFGFFSLQCAGLLRERHRAHRPMPRNIRLVLYWSCSDRAASPDYPSGSHPIAFAGCYPTAAESARGGVCAFGVGASVTGEGVLPKQWTKDAAVRPACARFWSSQLRHLVAVDPRRHLYV